MRRTLHAIRIAGMLVGAIACASSSRSPVVDSRNNYGDQVITGDKIDSDYSSNVWDLLRHLVPRYNYVEDKSGRAMSITGHRGKSSISVGSSEQALVLLDGARLNTLELLQTMPPNSVDKIEIQGGSRGTRKEGTNASAGVIYIYSRSH